MWERVSACVTENMGESERMWKRVIENLGESECVCDRECGRE